jgi:DNA recombination protein RmuC
MSTLLLVSIFISILAGAFIGWAVCYLRFAGSDKAVGEIKHQSLAKDREIHELRERMDILQREKAVAETRAEEANKRIEEQKAVLEKAQERMTTTFQALSGESLKSNNRAFLELAKESLDVVLKEARGDVEKKEESIKSLVKPLEEALKRYEHQISEMEKARSEAYGGLGSQISSLLEAQQALQKETGNLITALRRPEVRGRWGEITLKRVAELAGMIGHCDYTEQVSVNTEDGRIRPDMIVHLPAGREIVVDSKVSLDAYLDAVSADTAERKKELMTKHAQQVRKHMRDLAGKSYWSQFSQAPEFVVMFIPGEAFMSAAVENDPALIEDGMESKVIIATPTTLIALLRAIAYGWRQERITQNAQEIADLGRELYDRFQPFLEHVNKTGSFLSQAVFAFNKMVMSLERRVMVSVRKFRELGASTDKELEELKQVEQIPMKAGESETLEEQVEVETRDDGRRTTDDGRRTTDEK